MSLPLGEPGNRAISGPVGAPRPPAALLSSPDAITLAKCLRRCWGRAVLVGFVGASLTAFVAWHMIPPSKYVARTLIHVPPFKDFLLPAADYKPTLADHQRTQVALAKSRLVLNAALTQPGVSELGIIRNQTNALEWLERTVQVDFTVAPEVIRIAISGDSPDDLSKLVSALRAAYCGEILDKDRTGRMRRLNVLVKQRQAYSDELRAKTETQRQLERQGAAKDTAMRGMLQSIDQMRLSWYEKDLIQTESELSKAKIELAINQEGNKGSANAAVPEAEIQSALNKDPLVLEGLKRVKDAKDQIAAMAAKLAKGEADPLVQPYHKRLADAEQALGKLKTDLGPQISDSIRTSRRSVAFEAAHQLEIRVTMLAANAQSLREQLDELRQRMQKMNDNNVQLDTDRESTARLEGLVKRIADEEVRLQFELETNPIRFEIIEEATVLGAADDKKRNLGAAGSFAGMFALLLFAFAFYEFYARKVGTVDEVVHGLGLNLVGAIPASNVGSSAIRATTVGDGSPHNTLAEAIDATRVMLLRFVQSESLQVVMITSANSGEGKTSLSAHLAASLAQANYRTLLIDGDLRNPVLQQVFGVDITPGFCEILREEATTEEAVRSTSVDGLSIIPAGRWSIRASRALGRDGVAGRVLRQFREQFDFVVIDSSPVLPVVDPLLIGQLADGTILSVLRDISRMPNVYAAHQRLTAVGVRVLGAVVNGVRNETYGAAYPLPPRVGA
jgi:polysaccharide biosynthesis transport protein